MQLLCPACRTPLPATPPGRLAVLTCDRCSAEVDVSRAGTAAGRPRFVPEIDRTGDTVAGFVLEARIGAGGMGTVYRARRPGDGGAAASVPVAIKFLSPALASEPDVVARFQREVKLLRSLEHPAIVRVLDHGEESGVPWFAMELVEGPDLRTRLSQGPLAPEELASVFGRLFDALGHAHAKGIIHRDLKPANVLLASDGAKLADFGIARLDPDAASHATRLTETAAVLGTFPYMSPEQRAGADVDRRSDLFSAGVLLYEALTGKVPQGAFALPSRVNPALSPRLDLVVSKLMQPDRDARYATAGDAAVAFHDAIRPRPSMAPVIGFGAIAAIVIALVVPAAMNSGGGPGTTPVQTPTAAAATPSENTEGLALDPGGTVAMNAADVFPQDFAGQKAPIAKAAGIASPVPSPSPVAAEAIGKQKAVESGKKGGKADPIAAVAKPSPEPPSTPAPSATVQALSSGSTGSSPRAERNVIQALENQAVSSSAGEGVGMVTSCGTTMVYDLTSRSSKVLAKLPKGHRIDRLKVYRKLAWILDGVLGRGAGLFGTQEPPVKKTATKKVAASAPEPQAPRQESSVESPGELQQAVPEEVWYFVRYSAKDERGWILSECAASTKSDAPAYRSSATLD